MRFRTTSIRCLHEPEPPACATVTPTSLCKMQSHSLHVHVCLTSRHGTHGGGRVCRAINPLRAVSAVLPSAGPGHPPSDGADSVATKTAPGPSPQREREKGAISDSAVSVRLVHTVVIAPCRGLGVIFLLLSCCKV